MPTPAQIQIGGAPNALVWDELIDSDSGGAARNSCRSTRKWLVSGTLDADDIIAWIESYVPKISMRGNVPHLFVDYTYEHVQPATGAEWIVTVNYAFQVEEYELQFDSGGETTKAQQALDDGDYYNCITAGDPNDLTPSGQDTADFGRLVGVNGDSVDGATIPTRGFKFTVLIRNRFSTLSADYIDTLTNLKGRANDRDLALNWKGQILPFLEEELLFEDFSGKMTSDLGFELSLKFSKSPTRKGGTWLTAGFTQPAVNANVTVTVAESSIFTAEIGTTIFLAVGGYYIVIATPSSTTLTLQNTGHVDNAAPGASIDNLTDISADDEPPLVIGNSGPIYKAGQRYLWTNAAWGTTGGRRVLQPSVAVVNKMIPVGYFGPIGIFTDIP